MKLKPLLIGGVLLVLLIGFFLMQKVKGPESQPSVGDALPLGILRMSQVERIQIGSHPGVPVLVTIVKAKQGADFSWRIPDLGNAKADGEKIDQLLGQLQKIAGEMESGGGAEASPLPEKEEFFRVSLYDGNWNPIFALLIGKEQDPAGRFWVCQEGSEWVHWTQIDLLPLIQNSFVEDPSAV